MGWNRQNGTLTVAVLVALTGCGDGGDGSVDRKAQMISGRIESSASVEGSTVDAYEVSSSGEAVAESNPDTEGTADASGEYDVEVAVSGEATTTVLIETMSGQTRRAVLVTSEFSADATVVAEPMTEETTFESDVYLHALAEGSLCEDCSSALVLDFIGRAGGEAHANGGGGEASLDAGAEMSSAAVETFVAALAAQTEEGASSLDAAFRAHLEARLARAEALDDATNEAQAEAAEEDYIEAVVSAYAEAGVDLDEQAAAMHAAAERAGATLDTVGSLDAEIRASLRADVEMRRALVVSWAIEAQAEAAGASEASLEAARDTLRASLEEAASAGASAEAEIDAAWDAYRVEVRAALRASLESAEQTAFDTILPVLESAAATVHTTLDASFSLSGDASAWIEPLLEFSLSGDAQVDALVTAGASEAEATAILKILLSVELAAG